MVQHPLHHCVEVIYDKTDQCPTRNRPYFYFQLIYILTGGGFIDLNDNRTPYRPGDLFLITPNDSHNFQIDSITEFVLIRFSPEYVKEYGWKSIDHIQALLQHAPQLPGALTQSESERFQTRHIIDLLLHDLGQMDAYNQDLRRYFVNALIVIVTRNIGKEKPAHLDAAAGSRIQEIVGFIRANINKPELLKASAIGKQFGISETYLGTFFKHHSGETIQSFISRYKLRQIEHRLRYSDMRVGEIAIEFGFADESHLNKFFKKHHSLNLTEFRKKSRNTPFQPTDANRISNLENFQ